MSLHAKKLDYNNNENLTSERNQAGNMILNNNNFQMNEVNYYPSNVNNNNSKNMPLLNDNQQIMNQMP